MSEDHNSDTSGETTTCDSGRGASDEEIVYPLTGKSTGEKTIPSLANKITDSFLSFLGGNPIPYCYQSVAKE